MSAIAWSRIETRFGAFHAAAMGNALVQTSLPGRATEEFLSHLATRYPDADMDNQPDHPILVMASRQLREYADGKRRTFDVPLRLDGTAFQSRVWGALSEIPFGDTRSYQDIARAIGRPGASRAVGQANHHNPLAPIIPCHRVVNSSGGLGGYGGGMDLKRTLLAHEGIELE
jgi:methylated-DNA-[protein]-cysteine S-methyltransferase